MIKAIIFDFDGVIAESVEIKGDVFVELFRNYPSYSDQIREYHLANGGLPRHEKFRFIYSNILHERLTEEDEKRLSMEFSKLVIDRVVNCPFVPGAFQALDRYSQIKRLFVVSATPHVELMEIIRRKGIERFFMGVHGTPPQKVDIIRRIMAEQNFSGGEMVFIGDSIQDCRVAHSIGIPFIARVSHPQLCDYDGYRILGTVCDLHGLNRFIR